MISITGETKSFQTYPDERGEHRPEPRTLDLLSILSTPLIVIDDSLRVVTANAEGMRQLPDGSPAHGFFRLLAEDGETALKDLRREAIEALARRGKSLLLLRPRRRKPLICSITPMDGRERLGLVALAPLTGEASRVAACLKSAYKLSNAEAEIAATAASGMDVVQIAQCRGVSIHTLRAQVAAIKTKMGMSRITEIAATVGRIEAAVSWL